MSDYNTVSSITSTYNCSGTLGKFILSGMREIIGDEGTHSLLNRAQAADWLALDACRSSLDCISYRQISRLQQALECQYGERSGRGLAQRTGRAAFHYSLRSLGVGLGLGDFHFRLLPPHQKVWVGVKNLARLFQRLSDQVVTVREGTRGIQWIVERCPLCWGRHADGAVCHMNVGFLQEFVSWASGGLHYSVVETECIAAGAPACVFTIDRMAGD